MCVHFTYKLHNVQKVLEHIDVEWIGIGSTKPIVIIVYSFIGNTHNFSTPFEKVVKWINFYNFITLKPL